MRSSSENRCWALTALLCACAPMLAGCPVVAGDTPVREFKRVAEKGHATYY
ncbi:hypothetical protein LCGC14_2890640, partial [marine sediment metagenome]